MNRFARFNPLTARCNYCRDAATHAWRATGYLASRRRSHITVYIAACDAHVAAGQASANVRKDATRIR